MEERIKEEVRRENISKEKALYILKKDDDERRKWGLRVYGIDTWDSRLYDMVLHIQNLTVDDATEIKTIAEKVKGVKEVNLIMHPKTDDHHSVNPFHNI